MPLVALRSNAAFDSEDTELLGAAFVAAWEKLNTAGSALAEGSEAALTRDCWRNALSKWRSGARETLIAWSRTLWIIWRDRERPRIALSRRHPLCSATRRRAADQGRRAVLRRLRTGREESRSSGLVGRSLYQPAETLTHARTLRVGARLPYPLGPPDVFAMAVSVVARAA